MQNYNSNPIKSDSKFKIFSKLLTFALLTLIFNFALLTFNLGKVEASALSLGIYPPVIQIETIPPSLIKTPITIENLGEETVSLQILLKPFKASEKENGEISYLLENEVQGADPLIFSPKPEHPHGEPLPGYR